ncbi:hypothetical protein OEZ85_011450 [Tetradesmus obliquus]|uniref:Peptidase A1 domain-containing protein n=1 Tax=Tetradesmus obliquus TaxID=3088 RepID=A0ABY8TSL8_TETOB|nr:hypothetical protein OEZ85_011450 [Tetradesmus obliquus]
MPVLGAIREGYFYAQLGLGTPPRNFSTIIDTGSTITYVPCANCAHCGGHMSPGFDPALSSTAQVLGCQSSLCNCGSPACTCLQKKCYYSRRYAELSSSEGWLVQDKLRFPDNGSSLDFVFGCENKETGAIFKQQVDGVLGMGNNENSFPRQLARTGLVDDVFSLCYGFPAGGTMLLGDVPVQPPLQLRYTPLVERRLHYYNVGLQGISLGQKLLGVAMGEYAQGYGAVLDSGTTFTYLPTAAFNAFLGLLNDALQGKGLHRSSGSDPQFNDVCWRGAPHDFKALDKVFPTGSITFAGGASVALTPQRYLFMVGRGEYCLGMFDNGWQGTLLGGIIMRSVLVQYDRRHQRVGFAEADCNSIRTAPAASAPAATPQAGRPNVTAESAPAPAAADATMQKAILLLALVAAAFVASEAAYCHTSTYKVKLSDATKNKQAMFDACFAAKKIAVKPKIVDSKIMPDGCITMIQKVPSSAAWEAYSACEKSKTGVDNKALYEPLSTMSGPCAKYKKATAC